MNQPAWLRQACMEPYRFFFPLGLMAGLVGVGLWPLFFGGVLALHPGILHARFMVEGFMGGFVFGFLGTASPRLTGTQTFSLRECMLFLLLYLATLTSHLLGYHPQGDGFFLLLLAGFAGRIVQRILATKGVPLPGFILVGIGFAGAIAGVISLIVAPWGVTPAWTVVLGSSLLNEAWVLLLILGVGSFLFPRILQIQPLALKQGSSPGRRRRLLQIAGVGMAILSLYLIEAWLNAPRSTALARFLVAAAYFAYQIGVHRSNLPQATITRWVHLGVILTLFGLAFPLIWPAYRVAGVHFVFIGGFALITMTVATRVILGHGGLGALAGGSLPFLKATGLFFVAGLALRVGGDFLLPWRQLCISLGAVLWMAGALVWGLRMIPKVRLAPPGHG